MAKQQLSPGDSIYSTGVFLQLQKDNTWKVMSFDNDSFHEGSEVNGESAIPEQNAPYIGEDDEEE